MIKIDIYDKEDIYDKVNLLLQANAKKGRNGVQKIDKDIYDEN